MLKRPWTSPLLCQDLRHSSLEPQTLSSTLPTVTCRLLLRPQALSLHLLAERANGDGSFWTAYLRCLPDQVGGASNVMTSGF